MTDSRMCTKARVLGGGEDVKDGAGRMPLKEAGEMGTCLRLAALLPW